MTGIQEMYFVKLLPDFLQHKYTNPASFIKYALNNIYENFHIQSHVLIMSVFLSHLLVCTARSSRYTEISSSNPPEPNNHKFNFFFFFYLLYIDVFKKYTTLIQNYIYMSLNNERHFPT